ncbi:MAG: hypothetical protein AAF773_06130 [Cyanobacteria bacterium P01_D01_bin.115]
MTFTRFSKLLKRRRLLGAIAALMVIGWTLASAGREEAIAADSFVDMIGVATHLNYRDTAYNRYDELVKPRLQQLGVRHIRDGFRFTDERSRDRLLDLARIGVRATLVMDPRWIDSPQQAVAMAKATAPAIEAVEGPNEWDVWPDLTYDGSPFPDGLRQFQRELYDALKQDTATAALPVLSPSVAHWWNAPKLGRVACDWATMHSYAGGEMPSGGKLDVGWIPSAKLVCPNGPVVATEAGWHNAVTDARALQPGISEAASAKYAPRLYLEYFNRRVKRAFLYEFVNEWDRADQESNFGLVRYDGSPKPAFTALANLIELLADPVDPANSVDSFEPAGLSYRLSGDQTNVHHTLLQKRDRRFYLILWQEVPSFNLAEQTDITVDDRSLTLNLETPAAQIRLYQPVTNADPIAEFTDRDRIRLAVPDHPLVVELTPS